MSPNTMSDLAAEFLAMADAEPEFQPTPEPDTPASARYRMMSLADVIAQPPPVWVIDGVIATQAVSVLYGQWGIGKSFITLDWALSIATGRPWIDHQVQTGPVVYIAAEGAGGMGKRVQAWAAKTGQALPGPDRFIMIPEPVNLMDETTVSAFVAALTVAGIERPALIVFDTLSRCTLGGEENSNSEMSVAVARTTEIAQATGAAVLLVHHPGKGGDIRGASALPGNVETVIRVSNEEGVLKVECEKQKDGATFDPFHLMLHYIESADSMVVMSASGAALAGTRDGKLTTNQRRVLEALCSPSLAGCARQSELKEASGIAHPESFRRAADALINRGLVRVEGPPKSRDRRYYPTEAGQGLIGVQNPISHCDSQISHSESHSHMSHTPLEGCDSVTDVTDGVIDRDRDLSPAQNPNTGPALTLRGCACGCATWLPNPRGPGRVLECWDADGHCTRQHAAQPAAERTT